MNLQIRDAEFEDIEIIQDLSQKLSIKEEEEFDRKIDPEWNKRPEAGDYFQSRITGDQGYAIIAEHEENVIGYLVGGINEAEEFRDTETIAEAETMYIEPDYRGKGLGSKMFENFLEWGKKQEAERARVEASAGNTGAIEFYRHHEFEDYSLTLERDFN